MSIPLLFNRPIKVQAVLRETRNFRMMHSIVLTDPFFKQASRYSNRSIRSMVSMG